MTALRLPYVLLVAGALVTGIAIAALKTVYLDWRSGHVNFNTYSQEINWVGYASERTLRRGKTYFFPDSKPGLPQVRVYVPQRSREALVINLPDSIKEWQPAYLMYPDRVLRRVKIRYRGDAPFNWLFGKKAWRLKTRKSRTLSGTRVLNYGIPQFEVIAAEVLGMQLANDLGVLAPRARLVEFFVNDVSEGILNEFEHIDESFLRNRNLMPVNVYKGEQTKSDRAHRVDLELFNNPSLWSKLATNNQLAEEDDSDLAWFLTLVRDAETSEAQFKRLQRVASFHDWARFAAFQVLAQNVHNDSVHNMRLVSDAWSGQVLPVAHDVAIQTPPSRYQFLDAGSHELLRLYHRHSGFLYEKYKILYSAVTDGRWLERAVSRLDAMEEGLEVSLARDPNLAQEAYYKGRRRDVYTTTGGREARAAYRQALRQRGERLRHDLTGEPGLRWDKAGDAIRLVVGGIIPVSDVILEMPPEAQAPTRIAWDVNRDGRMDDKDFDLRFQPVAEGLRLSAVWLASRVMLPDSRNPSGKNVIDGYIKSVVRSASFDVIADSPLNVKAVSGANALTHRRFRADRGPAQSYVPDRWNQPIVPDLEGVPEVWAGTVRVSEDRIVDGPVRIAGGTRILMGPGVSLVFRQRVYILGTERSTVSVEQAVPGAPWGVVALQGPETEGSIIRHLTAHGGSGDLLNQIHYTAMLSVHDTANIELTGVTLRENHHVDDMLHVVYGRNIRLVELDLAGALSDGVDIDVSDVSFLGGSITASGNDAIDLMSSTAYVEGMNLVASGDKGVSVGEASTALVVDTLIAGSKIGVESKDNSTVQLLHCDLQDNQLQINAYAKNWRYGAGGTVEVRKSVLLGLQNRMETDKRSRVTVFDSTVRPFPKDESRRFLEPDVDESGGRIARSAQYDGSFLLPWQGPPSDEAARRRGLMRVN